MTLSPEKLDRDSLSQLYALAKKATRGPWEAHECCVYFPDLQGGFSLHDCPEPAENAHFIAAASPDVITALIDRARELETQLMHEIGAHCDTRWKLREARAALNKEQK